MMPKKKKKNFLPSIQQIIRIRKQLASHGYGQYCFNNPVKTL